MRGKLRFGIGLGVLLYACTGVASDTLVNPTTGQEITGHIVGALTLHVQKKKSILFKVEKGLTLTLHADQWIAKGSALRDFERRPSNIVRLPASRRTRRSPEEERIPGFLVRIALNAVLSMLTDSGSASPLVPVRGYFRSNGTWVAPHYRTLPDGVASNNWSY